MEVEVTLVARRSFRAMGSDCEITLVGGSPALLARAEDRIHRLESRWSRFLTDSEIGRLNRNAGDWTDVSRETLDLISHALEGRRLTRGSFDPLLLGDVIRAGYDRSFEAITSGTGASDLASGGSIEIRDRSVRIPRRTGFDPGGIGKGLAADIVAAELMTDGALGCCVNVGGDVRVTGTAPGGTGWTIGLEHPGVDQTVALVGIAEGAVATSTTLLRRWPVGDSARHHIIDPATHRPSASRLTWASVIAPRTWKAEGLAKAAIVDGSLEVVAAAGCDAIGVNSDGEIETTRGFDSFTGDRRIQGVLEGVAR